MAKTEIIGSWFNTGYHGHFKSKSRSDFINEFRHLAKPIPPSKFVQRTTVPVRQHVFSTHDNRNSFTTDALYFEQGLGRRRFKKATLAFHPEMLAWMPKKQNFDRATTKASVYKYDFAGNPPQEVKQQLVKRPKTSFDDDYRKVTTSYRYSHGEDNPNKEVLNVMCNTGLSTTPNRRMKSSNITGRESVASCMSWYNPKPHVKPTVPVATQTFPHPPRKLAPAATEIVPPSVQTAPAAPVYSMESSESKGSTQNTFDTTAYTNSQKTHIVAI